MTAEQYLKAVIERNPAPFEIHYPEQQTFNF